MAFLWVCRHGRRCASTEELAKDERIKKAYNRIKRKYRGIARNELDLLTPLMKRTAYLEVSLEDLEEIINLKGFSDDYQNGEKQSGTKSIPEVNTYIAFSKQHANNIKLLDDKLPPEQKKSKLSEFLND